MVNIKKNHYGTITTNIVIILAALCVALGGYTYYSNQLPVQKEKNKPIAIDTHKKNASIIVQEVKRSTRRIVTNNKPSIVKTVQIKKTPVLPELDNSDPLLIQNSQSLFKNIEQEKLLIKTDIVRNFVVFVDNFSQGVLLTQFSNFKAPKQRFLVEKQNHNLYLNPKSYQRYNIYADIIANIDTTLIMQEYKKLQPLFDKAYSDISYNQQSFNTILSLAIENVLQTPIIEDSIELVSPSVMYRFADDDLETLPATQKLLIRMGPKNTIKIKNKLRDIQKILDKS
ncbi:DUF3014 domain-containing protein [Psychromonas sp. CD1]|uniref:DUF3014 domain-containing protein n=1 Tax=Psychromonas sp. CD1 TaxID=1979839 RepID=UPI000B9C59A1|nr:DUF3014 domain-containing protein [Psychromonas sp. CD1]